MDKRTIKMRTAICFGGELRTIEQTLPLIQERILSHFSNYDIFFFTWTDDPNLKSIKYLLKTNKVVDFDWEPRKSFDIKTMFPNKPLDIQWQCIPRQLYCIKKVNDIKSQYEKDNNFKYDMVVRIRPDLLVIHDSWLDENIETLDMKNNIYMLDHDKWHGCCDRFFISSSENMDFISNGINDLTHYSEIGGRNYGEGFLQFLINYHLDISITELSLKTCLLRNNGVREGELIHIEQGTIERHEDGKIWHKIQGSYI